MAIRDAEEGQTRVFGVRRAAASRLVAALLAAAAIGTTAGVGAVPTAVAPRTQGTLVYEEDGWIYRARLDGTRPVRLARGEWPELSPDGRWISFERERGYASYDIHVLPVAGGRSTIVSRRAWESDWTSDSNWLVVNGDPGTTLVDRRSGDRRLVLANRTTAGSLGDVSISASGDRLVFVRSTVSNESEPSNIFATAMEGGESVQLTTDGDSDSPLAGPGLIAFRRWTAGGGALWVMNHDGSGARQVTAGDDMALEPVFWLPGGRTVVGNDVRITASGPYHGRLFAVDVVTGSTRPLTPWREGLEPLDLSRDGRAILVRTECTYFGILRTYRPGGLSTVLVARGTSQALLDGPCSGSWNR